MMWLSYLTKSLSIVLVLPLVLSRFSVEDISLWYLFLAVIGLQLLADLGFTPTFTRVIAYATAGASVDELSAFRSPRKVRSSGTMNWETIEAICGAMRVVYDRMTFVSITVLATLGTLAVRRPIGQSSAPDESWAAWGVIVVGSCIVLRGNQFSAYLQGLNRIALLRRWEALMNLGAVMTMYLVMLVAPSILALVVADQTWKVLNVVRNYILCRAIESGRFAYFDRVASVHPTVMSAVWPSAWRTGLGALMAQAPLQFSGLFYAQIGRPDMVASYLLGLNLLGYVRAFSLAPFYSKLPVLASLRASGRTSEQLVLARRGMRLSLGVFCAGFFVLGLFGNWAVGVVGSNAAFPFPLLFNLLAVGMLIERYGGMHLQLYMTTNHVVAHFANGVTGLFFILLVVLLIGPLDILAFPLAYILSYSLFYAPYAASKSYRLFSVGFLEAEKTSAVPVIVITVAYLVLSWALGFGQT